MISHYPETGGGSSEVLPLELKISSEWAPLQVALFHDASNMIDRSLDASMVDPNVLAKHPEQGSVRKEVVMSSLDLLRPLFSELLPLDTIEDRNHLAANMLWLNSKEVASTTDAPNTNRLLRGMGYAVHEVEYGEVIHRWGSVRCTVGPLVRRPHAFSRAGLPVETQIS